MSSGFRLRECWLRKHGRVRPGASDEALSAFELRLGVVLPPDFRAYLNLVDGSEEAAWVGPPIDFWRLARIEKDCDQWGRFEAGAAGTLLPFADFLISSYAFAITVSASSDAVFLVGGNGLVVERGSSFAAFVDLYEADSDALHDPA